MRKLLKMTNSVGKELFALCRTRNLAYLTLLIIVVSGLLFISQKSLTVNDLTVTKIKVSQSVKPEFESIELNEVLQDRSNQSIVLIDSRIAEEYNAGHIPGALNIPANQIPLLSSNVINKFRNAPAVIVYCNGSSCPLAAQAAQSFVDFGFDNVKLYNGGWPEWHSCGLPIALN